MAFKIGDVVSVEGLAGVFIVIERAPKAIDPERCKDRSHSVSYMKIDHTARCGGVVRKQGAYWLQNVKDGTFPKDSEGKPVAFFPNVLALVESFPRRKSEALPALFELEDVAA